MAIAAKLKKYLDSNKVKYKALKHKLAYTAQEIAAAQEVPGKQVVKSVLVKAGDKFVLAVLPAIHLIDAKKLKTVLKCKSIKIATEKDIEKVIPVIPSPSLKMIPVEPNLKTISDRLLRLWLPFSLVSCLRECLMQLRAARLT